MRVTETERHTLAPYDLLLRAMRAFLLVANVGILREWTNQIGALFWGSPPPP